MCSRICPSHLCSAVVSCLLLTACAERESPSPEQVVEEVRSIVAAHWAAINTADEDAISEHHTDSLTLIMADFPEPFALDSPGYEELVETEASWQPQTVHVQPAGEAAAVASFLMDGTVTWPDGTTDSRTRRVTEVWIREDGGWKELHHHDSVHAPLESRAGDVEAIRAHLRRATQVNNAGDSEGWLDLFTEDAVVMPEGAPAVTGAADLRALIDDRFAEFDSDIVIEPVEIEVLGGVAIVRTVVTGTLSPKAGGEPIEVSAKEIAILERQDDDGWKVSRLIGNSDSVSPDAPA